MAKASKKKSAPRKKKPAGKPSASVALRNRLKSVAKVKVTRKK